MTALPSPTPMLLTPRSELRHGYDVFVSHAPGDAAWAEGVVASLERRGLRIQASRSAGLEGERSWHRHTMSAIEASRAFLAVLTPEYLARPACVAEWEAAAFRNDARDPGFVFQVLLARCDLTLAMMRLPFVPVLNERNVDATAVQRLLDGISGWLEREATLCAHGQRRRSEAPPQRDPYADDDVEGRQWREVPCILVPTGRTGRGPLRPNGLDQRRRAFYDDNWRHWDLFESDMSALAKMLSPGWQHGASDVEWVLKHMRRLAEQGGFVEHLHLIGEGSPGGAGGLKLGSQRIEGYWDGFALGRRLANVLTSPGTVTLWAPGSGLTEAEHGRTITGLAVGSGCRVAGLVSSQLILDKRAQDRWRATATFEQRKRAWPHADQTERQWAVAYPDGTVELADNRDPEDARRLRPYGPLDVADDRHA